MGALLSACGKKGQAAGDASMVPDKTTGLTKKDRDLITETWAVVGTLGPLPDIGVEFFIQLFTAHPYMQDYFDHFKGLTMEELRQSADLKAHATNVMNALNSYVENVNNPEVLVAKIKKVTESHVPRNITMDDYENLKSVLLSFLMKNLGEKATKDVETAWNKLLTAHNSVVKMTFDQMSGS